MKIIRTTYSIVTEKSARYGDFAETGWIDEDGEEFTDEPAADETEFDDDYDGEAWKQAARWLRNKGAAEPSSSQFHPGIWYSTIPPTESINGEWETRSFHLVGWTVEEQREIYNRVTARG